MCVSFVCLPCIACFLQSLRFFSFPFLFFEFFFQVSATLTTLVSSLLIWIWHLSVYGPDFFLRPLSLVLSVCLPPSLVSFHLLLCAHLSIKNHVDGSLGWSPCYASVGAEFGSSGPTWKVGQKLRIREADTGDPWGDLTAFTHPNQWILSSADDTVPTMKCRAPEKDITHQLQTSRCICTCTHVSMHVCMHFTQACKDTDKTHIQRDKYCPFFLWYHTGVLVCKHLLF